MELDVAPTGPGEEVAAAVVPLDAKQVFDVIQGAFSQDVALRGPAEAALKAWEADAKPGFVSSLTNIIKEYGAVDEPSRLLAAVVAKNAVGSSWRKTMGTREWSRVPEDEKGYVRSSLMTLLQAEPSNRVALQLALLIANVARFDFPGRWGTLLTELAAMAAWESGAAPVGKLRVLLALKYVFRALRSKRIVVEAPANASGGFTAVDMKAMSQRIGEERKALQAGKEAALAPLSREWRNHFAASISGGAEWELRGRAANACLSALRELLHLLPSWKNIKVEMRELLEAVHQATLALLPILPTGEEDSTGARAALASKAYERMVQCALAAMDTAPMEFAVYLPFFLQLYGVSALLAMDATAVHRIRAKRRVLLTRFLARALLCPFYRPEWLDAPGRDVSDLGWEKTPEGKWKHLAALDAMLSNEAGQCAQLVEAIVAKYVALAPEELDEWQADPEGYVRSGDVESSPDADTPRPCGLALLLCMLDRGPEATAAALTALGAQLQGLPPSPATVLLREAVYRAIGEGYTHLRQQITFAAWYESELQGLISQPQTEDVHANVLTRRALWLVGVCGGELPEAMWRDAFARVMQHMGASDLVVALTAVSAVMSLCSSVLEDEQLIAQLERQQRVRESLGRAGPSIPQQLAGMSLDSSPPHDALAEKLAATTAALEGHTQIIAAGLPGILAGAFALVGRLEQVESMVRVLHLVSVVVEVMGPRTQPHLSIIAAQLPQIWGITARQSARGEDTGAIARLHSALMAVLTHLISRLGPVAMQDPQVQGITFELLQHAINVAHPEAETLMEEALRLVLACLSGQPTITPPFEALLPKLLAVLARGRDNDLLFTILNGYLLLGGLPMVLPHLPAIAAAMQRSIASLALALQPAEGQEDGDDAKVEAISQVSQEAVEEALSVSGLAALLLQLLPEQAPAFLEHTLRGMAEVVASRNAHFEGMGSRLLSVAESFFEVLARLIFKLPAVFPQLLQGDREAEGRFLDRWITTASTRYLEEILGVAAGAAQGCFRRHMAAVAMCALICAGATPALAENKRLAKALLIGLRAMKEAPAFLRLNQGLEQLGDENNETDEQDQLVIHRMLLVKADDVRAVNITEAVNAAAKCAVVHTPKQQLLEDIGWLDRVSEQLLQNLLKD